MATPFGTRVVLQANVGQYDSSTEVVAASLLTLNSNDTQSGSLRNTIFAQRNYASLAIGDPVFTSFAPNSSVFLRRVRIASEHQAYGLKLLNRGTNQISSSSPRPLKSANSSYFQIWLMRADTNAQVMLVYESDTIPLLNEWYDANLQIPTSGGGIQNVATYFAAVFNIDADYTDISTRLVTVDPVAVRIEMEIDCELNQINQPPTLPPTNPKTQTLWATNLSLTNPSIPLTTIRTGFNNVFGQPIKTIQAGYMNSQASGASTIVLAYIGSGGNSGANYLDFATWQQALFSGNPTLNMAGAYSLNSPGTFMSDLLTFSTPVPVNGSFCISTVMSAGAYTGSVYYIPTPTSQVEYFSSSLPGSHGNDSGQLWSVYGPFASMFFVVGF
jgi:hypothetical protein